MMQLQGSPCANSASLLPNCVMVLATPAEWRNASASKKPAFFFPSTFLLVFILPSPSTWHVVFHRQPGEPLTWPNEFYYHQLDGILFNIEQYACGPISIELAQTATP